MSLTRREWLKGAGLLGAGLWLGGGVRLSPALAQSSTRKLALLVGINQYPKPSLPLKGCVTDVQLFTELLIHQFGFAKADVLTLTDEAATRGNIEAAFMTHLSEQARPGDIVVFLFSGYGCLVRTKFVQEAGISAYTLAEQQALVPVDGWIPNIVGGAAPIFNGIYEDTLFLLLRSLLTDQVTTILDAGLQPAFNLRSRGIRERALPLQEVEIPSAAELTLQERLLQQANLTRDQVQAQRQAGQLPGLVLTAATTAQPTALEVDWPEFSTGLFSYGLTQQCWGQSSANLTVQFNRLSNQMAQRVGEIPQPAIRGQKNFGILPWAASFTETPQAVGLITSVNRSGQSGEVWLGGLQAEILALCQTQSCFRVTTASPKPTVSALSSAQDSQKPSSIPAENIEIDSRLASSVGTAVDGAVNDAMEDVDTGKTRTLVQIRGRRGFRATADRIQGPLLQQGDYLAEAVRVLPKDVGLRLALGSNLNRIERVDATSFISMENKSLQVVGDSQPADYVFTKISTPTSGSSESVQSRLEATDSYGIAYLSGVLLPNTAAARESVVKLALQRLRPRLDSLLALKLLILSVNEASSLRVSATLEQIDETPQPLIRLQTPRLQNSFSPEASEDTQTPKANKTSKTLTIPSGTVIQYRVENGNNFPIYLWLAGTNDGIAMFSSYAKDSASLQPDSALSPLIVQPGASVLLPTASQTWKASSTAGLNQSFLFVTRQPLVATLALQAANLNAVLPSAITGFIPLPNPRSVIQKLFEDLNRLSADAIKPLGIQTKNVWALDTEAWSCLQFVYRTI